MYNFTTRYINITSLIISIIFIICLNNYVFSIHKINEQQNEIFYQSETPKEQKNNVIKDKTKENNTKNTANLIKNNQKTTYANKETTWQIEIPKINLKAEISEGTSNEVMDSFVGHFEETTKDTGNIGLAAHNRGYKVNYFQDLKKLKEGDEIIYKYNGKQRKYKVEKLKIIKDTDWSLLENTKDNRITLITCVENQPEYRRCVQGIEI